MLFRFLLSTCSGALLFGDHSQLHFLALILDLIGLLDDGVLPLYVQVRHVELHDRLEFLVVVHLVQIHTVWQHLLNVTDLYRVRGCQVLAVEFNAGGVRLVEAPHVNILDHEHEVGTGLPVERLVFLDWVDGDFEEVGAADYVALELHEEWVLSLEVVIHRLQRHADLLVLMADIEWTHRVVLASLDEVRGVPREDYIQVFELLARLDHRCFEQG